MPEEEAEPTDSPRDRAWAVAILTGTMLLTFVVLACVLPADDGLHIRALQVLGMLLDSLVAVVRATHGN